MSRIILNLIRSEIGSQCRSNKTGVMRLNLNQIMIKKIPSLHFRKVGCVNFEFSWLLVKPLF